jgi:4-amino-4-deoxy-L-arabinose transferase-like glycosyltransferase
MRAQRVPRAPPIVFLLALAARVAVAARLPAQIVWEDGQRYEGVALSLYHGHGFGSLLLNGYSVPTQALLIAGVYEVFGQSYLALRLVCAVLGALSCLIGYFIARRLFGSSIACLAGVMLALYPYLVYVSALFEYPQVFFILIVALFFLFLLRFQEVQSRADLIIAGNLLGIAILSVPTILLFAPLAAAYVWLTSKAGRWLRAILFVAALAIPVGSWAVRNYVAYDHLILVNDSSGINFWVANNDTYYQFGKAAVIPYCSEDKSRTKFCDQWTDLNDRLLKSDLTETQRHIEGERIAWQKGLEFVEESPLRFVKFSLQRFLRYWSPIPDAVSSSAGTGGSERNMVAIVSYTPVLILGIVGIFLTRFQWRQLMPIYGYFLVFMSVYSIFLPVTRYRLPLDFFLVIFAAVAINRLWSRLRMTESQPSITR